MQFSTFILVKKKNHTHNTKISKNYHKFYLNKQII